MTFSIAVHGGAGLIRRHSLGAEREAACRQVLRGAIDAGTEVLARGGDALEAAIAAVVLLEDSPLFNAGRGGVFAADGTVQLDAAVMHGKDRSAGGVCAVRGIRNPILGAEVVRSQSPAVLLAGVEAERFLTAHGIRTEPPDYFHVQERWDHFLKARAAGRAVLDHDLDDDEEPKGTVGCVARDVHGHVAAATSTGGLANKLSGRVGDSPVPGAGTFAWDATCAVSATGVGEAVLRSSAAARVSALMELAGLDLDQATRRVVFDELPALGGVGGLIAVDGGGRIVAPFDSAGMYRAIRDTDGNVEIAIW
ncbi:MAG: isoaspartyl peptidase/L-asparaginase [Alphaproteobacteria bacterium]|nr:isoaspartyl peptidase/L-asparaginase [Alphaproteobacteria bacterium]